jgi:hemerythrin superfamily protein
MDPVKLIKQDHRNIKALFRKFEKASRPAERKKLGEEIIEQLSVHSTLEEQLIYSALRARDKRLEGPVLDAIEEHHAVKMVLAELDRMDADDDRYGAKMHFVQEAVEIHIEQEEARLLPRLQRLLDDEDSARMVKAMTMMRKVAPKRPHRLALDLPPGAVIAAMLAKLNDTGKDLIRRLTNGDKTNGHRAVARRRKASAAAIAAKRARHTGEARRGTAAH